MSDCRFIQMRTDQSPQCRVRMRQRTRVTLDAESRNFFIIRYDLTCVYARSALPTAASWLMPLSLRSLTTHIVRR